MEVTLGLLWGKRGYFGVTLGLHWSYIGVIYMGICTIF